MSERRMETGYKMSSENRKGEKYLGDLRKEGSRL